MMIPIYIYTTNIFPLNLTYIFSLQISTTVTRMLTICPDIDECLVQLADNDKLAVAVSRKHALNNAVIPNWMIYCFEDTKHFYGYPISLLMPQNHPLKLVINEHIQWALEGGLFIKWLSDSKVNFKQQSRIDYISAHPVKFEQISIGWVFLLFFTSLAFIIFIVEHIINLNIKKSNTRQIWIIANMLFDGQRYFWLPPSGRKRILRQGIWTWALRKQPLRMRVQS